MASGDTLLIFTPLSNEPTSASFATLDIRNQHPVLDFDATDAEFGVFTAVMPRNYAGTTGITGYISAAFTSATSGSLVFGLSIERIGSEVLDIDSDSFAASQSVTIGAPGTNGQVITGSVALTDGAQMDGLLVGEAFRLKIVRDVADASDTATGDAEMLTIEIKET